MQPGYPDQEGEHGEKPIDLFCLPTPKPVEPLEPIDLEAILNGDLSPELPTVSELDDGKKYLLYAGRINEIHAKPGVAKTNIALSCAIRTMKKGGVVFFIDPEDNPKAIVRRLLALGCPINVLLEGMFCYYENPTSEELRRIREHAKNVKPELVIVDGLAATLVNRGLDEDIAGDVLPVIQNEIKPFAKDGAAVLVTDHVAKNLDDSKNAPWPRGSGAKLGEYDGAVLYAKLKTPYTPEQAGSVLLIVAKDRNGGLGGVGEAVAEVTFTPDDNAKTEVEILTPEAKENAPDWKPTWCMQRVYEELEKNITLSKAALCKLVRVKTTYVYQAIRTLVREGYVRCEEKKGCKPKWTLLKPFKPAENT